MEIADLPGGVQPLRVGAQPLEGGGQAGGLLPQVAGQPLGRGGGRRRGGAQDDQCAQRRVLDAQPVVAAADAGRHHSGSFTLGEEGGEVLRERGAVPESRKQPLRCRVPVADLTFPKDQHRLGKAVKQLRHFKGNGRQDKTSLKGHGSSMRRKRKNQLSSVYQILGGATREKVEFGRNICTGRTLQSKVN